MKNIRNERGFTLIELLAVIVVLAIVMLMGAMAVIPRMNDARKQAFALEANTAIQGAQQYLMSNELKASGSATVFPTSAGTPVCVTIEELINDGTIDFDSNYKGYVLIEKKEANKSVYLYQITMTNGTIAVYQKGVTSGTNVDITSDMVTDYTAKDIDGACPSTLGSINK